MELTINDLGVVWEAVYEVRTKAYDMGLLLKVRVDTLDSIEDQYDDPGTRLRQVLKTWLKTATKPTWQDIVHAMKSCVVGQLKLASEIEAKHCTTAETRQASGEITEVVAVLPQQPTTGYIQLQTLQQALQDSQELLRMKDQKLQNSQEQIQQFTQHVKEKQHMIDNGETKVHKLNQQLEAIKQDLLQSKKTNRELQAANDRLKQELQQVVKDTQTRQRQLQELNQQLHAMKRRVEQPQETIQLKRQLQTQMEEKKHAIEAREGQPWEQLQVAGGQPQKPLMQQKIIRDMKWQKESKAPEKMYRGSATSDSNMAYFNGHGSTKVYSYDSDTQKWCQLPDTPHKSFTIVVIEQMLTNILTMVGGYLSGKVTNSLLSLIGEGGTMKWLPHFPAMPTGRQATAVIYSSCSLIVAGGSDGNNRLATVEVLDTDSQQWSTACSLPHPFSLATISICGQRLYMMGGHQTGGVTRSVLACSVHDLRQSQTQPLTGKLRTAPASQSTIWRQVADAPHYYSSCATLCGQLVAVGGWEADKDTAAIFIYNQTTDSWEAIGDMPTARHLALVAILNGNMMVVGGDAGTETDIVELLY